MTKQGLTIRILPPFKDCQWSDAVWTPLGRLVIVWGAQPLLSTSSPPSLRGPLLVFDLPFSSWGASAPSCGGEHSCLDRALPHEWFDSVELSPNNNSSLARFTRPGPPLTRGARETGWKGSQRPACWWSRCWSTKPLAGCLLLSSLFDNLCSNNRTWLSTSAACNICHFSGFANIFEIQGVFLLFLPIFSTNMKKPAQPTRNFLTITNLGKVAQVSINTFFILVLKKSRGTVKKTPSDMQIVSRHDEKSFPAPRSIFVSLPPSLWEHSWPERIPSERRRQNQRRLPVKKAKFAKSSIS